MTPSRVSLARAVDRYSGVKAALELIQDELKLEGVSQILVKPNLTSTSRLLAVTHPEALRALLDFLRERTDDPITLGESSGTVSAGALAGFKKFGYLEMGPRYGLRFLDFNQGPGIPVTILDSRLRPLTVQVAAAALEAGLRISITPPKTHDFVIFTGAVKNFVMGCVLRRPSPFFRLVFSLGQRLRSSSRLPVSGRAALLAGRLSRNDKMKMHQGYALLHVNLCRVARAIPPHLAVLDGFEAMEGAGPVDGQAVPWGVALAATDAVAADSLAAYLLGFPQIAYLHYCQQAGLGKSDLDQIQVVGERPEAWRCPLRPHPHFKVQVARQRDGLEQRPLGELLGLGET